MDDRVEPAVARRLFLRPLAAVGITLACYVVLQVAAALFMIFLGTGYAFLPSYAIAVVVPVLLITRAYSPSVRTSLGLGPVRVAPLVFTLGASFSFVLLQYHVAGLLEKLLPMPSWMQDFLLEMTRIRNLAEGLRVVSGVVIAAAIGEELLFRGFLQGALENRLRRWPAIVLTALMFAVLHDPWRLVPVFFIGVLFGYLASRSGSIYYAMLAHAVTNATSVAGLNILGAETAKEPAFPALLLPAMAVVFVVSIVGFARTAGESRHSAGQ